MDSTDSVKSSTWQNYFKLGASVRFGKQPDDPQILNAYLTTSEQLATATEQVKIKRDINFQVAYVLLETISDNSVPRHWRQLCLNHMYKPLIALRRLTSNQIELAELNALNKEIRVLTNYFL